MGCAAKPKFSSVALLRRAGRNHVGRHSRMMANFGFDLQKTMANRFGLPTVMKPLFSFDLDRG
jgi:hypothetical protein